MGVLKLYDALYYGLGAAATTVTVLQIKMILTVGSLLLIPLEPSQKQSVDHYDQLDKEPATCDPMGRAVSFCLTVGNTVS